MEKTEKVLVLLTVVFLVAGLFFIFKGSDKEEDKFIGNGSKLTENKEPGTIKDEEKPFFEASEPLKTCSSTDLNINTGPFKIISGALNIDGVLILNIENKKEKKSKIDGIVLCDATAESCDLINRISNKECQKKDFKLNEQTELICKIKKDQLNKIFKNKLINGGKRKIKVSIDYFIGRSTGVDLNLVVTNC